MVSERWGGGGGGVLLTRHCVLVSFFQPLPKNYADIISHGNTSESLPCTRFYRDYILCGIFLFGASAAGQPRRPASGFIGAGGVVAKPAVMYRWEVGPEAEEDVYCLKR